jgi:hypothetical protein
MLNNKPKMKSKSAISFKEFQNIANEVLEIGNDWGFYIDIETNHKLIDFQFTKIPKFNKQKYYYETIKEFDKYEEISIEHEDKYNNVKQDIKKDKNEKIIKLPKTFNYFCNFMKFYLFKYTCPIITTFVLSYYIFKVKN